MYIAYSCSSLIDFAHHNPTLHTIIMKVSSTSALMGAIAPLAAAFPAAMMESMVANPEIAARASNLLGKRDAADAQKIFEPVPMFNAEEQFVDVSEGSGHEYVAPDLEGGDLRGLCPGL